MPDHPELNTVIERVRTDAIGGAADTAKEVIQALAAFVRDSQADSVEALASEIEMAVGDIMRVMPSLAPPVNALHRMLGRMETALASDPTVDELKAEWEEATDDFFTWADTALDKVARYGAEKIANGDVVFTYSMSSTVWAIFREAKAQGKQFSVIVTESRPANEGLWTIDVMLEEDIPVSVSIDAAIGELVPQCDSVFVGADAISSYGYSLCKVGTYPTALVAGAHGVPFYVAADTLKFDPSTLLGLPYVIEEIHRHEVLDEKYPENVQVVGKLFDETPPHLVHAVITEMGLINPISAVSVMWQMKLSERLTAIIPSWARGEL